MRLPGEIRNEIYSYVLGPDGYEDDCVAVLPRDIYDQTSPYSLYYKGTENVWHRLNQLKYVCRQLYLETRTFGLHLHTNLLFARWQYPIYIPFENHQWAGLSCVRFFRTCSPIYIATLRSVKIDGLLKGWPRPLPPFEGNPISDNRFSLNGDGMEFWEKFQRMWPEVVSALAALRQKHSHINFKCVTI